LPSAAGFVSLPHLDEIRPLACTTGVDVQELDDELLVYDRERDVASRLNRSAALVWQSSDGTRTVADLVTVLAEELGPLADEDMVMVALDNLTRSGLLQSGYEARDSNAVRLTRRRFIRRVGVVGAAAMTLPVVHSLVVPPAAAAASGGGYPYYPQNSKLLSR
jgi:Coenzyme PQQ synthesis protein D (PqqD)